MSLNYKYDQNKQDQTQPEQQEKDQPVAASYGESYVSIGNGRHICFELTERNMIFLGYSFLVSGEFMPGMNLIVLTFTTHMVSLEGINLEPLFYQLMDHLPRKIVVQEKRYNPLDKAAMVVNKITTKQIGQNQ